MFRTILAIALGVTISFTVGYTQPDTLWTQTYGGWYDDSGQSVQQTSDGGFIIAGHTGNFGLGGEDVYLVKTDSTGTEEWSRAFGGSADDYGKCVQQTTDGGYIIAGYTFSYGSGSNDIYLIKTDSAGNEIWSHTFGGWDSDAAYSVQQTTDGGFIIVGDTESFSSSSSIYLIKTDNTGNLQWSRELGSAFEDYGRSVQQTSDGGYIVVGYKKPSGGNNTDINLIKTDALGYEQWYQWFGGDGIDEGYCVRQTSDGGFIITGTTSVTGTYPNDVCLLKTDNSGNQQWLQTFGGGSSDIGYSVRQTEDGGYIVVGNTTSFGAGGDDVYIINTNSSGDEQWNIVYGDYNYDGGSDVQQTTDGGYIIAGTNSPDGGSPYEEVLLIRLMPETIPDITVSLTPASAPIQIPAIGGSFDFNIQVTNNNPSITSFDCWTNVILPNGSLFGPLLGPVTITLPPGGTIDRDRSQVIPANAPSGVYTFQAWVGIHPTEPWNSDSFEFEKLGSTIAGNYSGWGNCGEPLVSSVGFGESDLPGKFALIGAYPNPFNPVTAISYQLPANSHVSLKVYNVSGREVATLVDGYRSAGSHEVTFDGSGLASGVYLYRLEANGQQAVGKMILLK